MARIEFVLDLTIGPRAMMSLVSERVHQNSSSLGNQGMSRQNIHPETNSSRDEAVCFRVDY
jgi:hypothetical protein